jgi:hypothetical protein
MNEQSPLVTDYQKYTTPPSTPTTTTTLITTTNKKMSESSQEELKTIDTSNVIEEYEDEEDDNSDDDDVQKSNSLHKRHTASTRIVQETNKGLTPRTMNSSAVDAHPEKKKKKWKNVIGSLFKVILITLLFFFFIGITVMIVTLIEHFHLKV